jgi:hypothetical protein
VNKDDIFAVTSEQSIEFVQYLRLSNKAMYARIINTLISKAMLYAFNTPTVPCRQCHLIEFKWLQLGSCESH